MKSQYISVVIPACDRIEFLSSTLACVLTQTLQPQEILLIDNSGIPLPISTTHQEQITYIRATPYCGASIARNIGVEKVSTEYVAFLDDDDLWESNYLEKVERCIRTEQPDLIVTRLDKLEDGIITRDRSAHGQLIENILLVKNPGITGSSIIVRKSTFLELKGFDPRLSTSQDKAIAIEMLRAQKKIRTLPEAQAIIREHGGGRVTSGLKLSDGIKEFLNVYGDTMTFVQKQHNLMKMWRHRAKAKQDFGGILRYTLHKYLFELCKNFMKS